MWTFPQEKPFASSLKVNPEARPDKKFLRSVLLSLLAVKPSQESASRASEVVVEAKQARVVSFSPTEEEQKSVVAPLEDVPAVLSSKDPPIVLKVESDVLVVPEYTEVEDGVVVSALDNEVPHASVPSKTAPEEAQNSAVANKVTDEKSAREVVAKQPLPDDVMVAMIVDALEKQGGSMTMSVLGDWLHKNLPITRSTRMRLLELASRKRLLVEKGQKSDRLYSVELVVQKKSGKETPATKKDETKKDDAKQLDDEKKNRIEDERRAAEEKLRRDEEERAAEVTRKQVQEEVEAKKERERQDQLRREEQERHEQLRREEEERQEQLRRQQTELMLEEERRIEVEKQRSVEADRSRESKSPAGNLSFTPEPTRELSHSAEFGFKKEEDGMSEQDYARQFAVGTPVVVSLAADGKWEPGGLLFFVCLFF
jgi:hypothetical protein